MKSRNQREGKFQKMRNKYVMRGFTPLETYSLPLVNRKQIKAYKMECKRSGYLF